ncbi:MAG: rRNA pseudouridine synthase [Spirochaetaceae bacterium]|jgi:23S rRNA pseudouridine2605 synthase|nr:rRNA pseudouridine synthase [Spirochaetaceae bacterium]
MIEEQASEEQQSYAQNNSQDKNTTRLQAYLAHSGIASRRESEKLILAGRVSVNGEKITILGTKVTDGDTVLFDGAPVKPESKLHYIAMNKPVGYLCSSSDIENRPLAIDLLPKTIKERLYNIGRLDFRSSGLIFWTNDGNFAAKLSHPSSGIEKEYIVEASSFIPDELTKAFEEGINVEGINYKCLRIVKTGNKSVRITLIEGKKNEIRKVFSHFHLHPLLLHRVRIGNILLGSLSNGKTRPLIPKELLELNR